MATQVISGFGEIQLRSAAGGLFIGGFSQIELTNESETIDARRYTNAGALVISDSYAKSNDYLITITQEVTDSAGHEMALGEKAEVVSTTTSPNAVYYSAVEASVPLQAPYEISLAGKVTTAKANEPSVMATMLASGTWNNAAAGQKSLHLNKITGTPTDGDFKIDLTTVGSEKAVFNAAQAGAPLIISYLETVTGKLSLGIKSLPTYLSDYYFSMKLISDEFPNGAILMLPQISKNGGFQVASGDIPLIAHPFKVGTGAGHRSPIEIIYL